MSKFGTDCNMCGYRCRNENVEPCKSCVKSAPTNFVYDKEMGK